jgi:hypothetical protein
MLIEKELVGACQKNVFLYEEKGVLYPACKSDTAVF